MFELFWSRLSGLLPFLASNYWLQNAITLSQIVSSWPSGLLVVALLFTWSIVYGSLHGPLAIGPLVHLAITQPPVDTLARKIGKVLAGHLVYLGSSQCGGGLFIMSSSYGGSACG